MGGWGKCQECGDGIRGGRSREAKAERERKSDGRYRDMGRWYERMGGCLQTEWSGKAKKRRLLLITARVLRFLQLAVVGACWIVRILGIVARATLLKLDFWVLLSFRAYVAPSRMCYEQ